MVIVVVSNSWVSAGESWSVSASLIREDPASEYENDEDAAEETMPDSSLRLRLDEPCEDSIDGAEFKNRSPRLCGKRNWEARDAVRSKSSTEEFDSRLYPRRTGEDGTVATRTGSLFH